MEERRDKQAPSEPGARRTPLPAAIKLSPVQEAWGGYVDHARQCPTCRSADAARCDTAERLYRAYEKLSDSAMRKLDDIG